MHTIINIYTQTIIDTHYYIQLYMHPILYIHIFIYTPLCVCVCVCVYVWDSLVAQMVKSLPAVQETQVQSLGWEERHGNLLQYSWLEHPMDRGA